MNITFVLPQKQMFGIKLYSGRHLSYILYISSSTESETFDSARSKQTAFRPLSIDFHSIPAFSFRISQTFWRSSAWTVGSRRSSGSTSRPSMGPTGRPPSRYAHPNFNLHVSLQGLQLSFKGHSRRPFRQIEGNIMNCGLTPRLLVGVCIYSRWMTAGRCA